ncbi:MAG: hypothetical protein AB8F34_06565 [Akkermansiaceae bacterium]
MKVTNKLTAIIASILAACSFSLLTSCDSDSSSSSSSSGSGDTGASGGSGGDTPAAGMRRITLAGSQDGTKPITSNSKAQVRIDGGLVSQMLIQNDGIIVVDVPFGSLLEVRFVPDANVIGSVGQVVCIYDDAAPQVLTDGEQAVLPGVPPFSAPLNVGSSGGVDFIQNPTADQLGGEFVLKQSSGATFGSLAGFNEGAVISFSGNSISIGGNTYSESTDPILQSAASQVAQNLSVQEGLENTQFFYHGTSSDFIVFVWAFDGSLAGQIGYATSSGTSGAATFCLDN